MPHAKILSIEQVGDLSYHGEDATLNRITDADRTEIIASLNAAAHQAAENSGLKQEAEQQVTARLTELMNQNGHHLEVDFSEEKNVPAATP